MRNVLITGLLALLWGVMASPALAEEEELAPGFDACMDKSDGSTVGMQDCYDKALKYWDNQLGMNYRKRMKACDGETGRPDQCRAQLKTAELAWISYKENMAKAIYLMGDSGTLASVQASAFVVRTTKSQAKLLGDGE